MGSAALYRLAKRGVRVLGIDRFAPPHDMGSSHGDSRITRLAIGEGVHYTPLVMRSHAIWREIEAESGAELMTQCGELIISSPSPPASLHVPNFFQNTVDAAERHGIAHERLDANAIRARFPMFNVADNEFGYFEPDAGFLRPEACVATQLSLAEKLGAQIHRNEIAQAVEPRADGVTLATDRGTYRAQKLIVATGSWAPQLLGGAFEKLLRIYRQTLFWYDIDGDASRFAPDRFPVFIWELPDKHKGIYGFPVIDGGLKVATEQYDATTDPQSVIRDIAPGEAQSVYAECVGPYLNGVSNRVVKAKACLYTVTPDAGFIIDHLPASERVIVASCCSGHGFKHSPAVGEILADLAEDRKSAFDLAPFRLARFG